jgi:molybdopterin-guanine dinucleotide biosynthesis protein A
MRRAGYVLTGGKSSRMKRDKALLPVDGATLVERVARAVSHVAGSVTLVGAPDRYAHLGLPVLPDEFPGCGPLSGIHAALAHSSADWNLIVACDMPNLDPAFLSWLFESSEEEAADVLLPAGPSGLPEPLCGVYHKRCLDSAEWALKKGRWKITEAFSSLRVRIVAAPESGVFENVNTPEDWAKMS